MKIWNYLLLAISVLIASCSKESDGLYEEKLVSITDFDDGTMDTWIVGFAQYPVGLEDSFRLSNRLGNFTTSNSGSGGLILRGKSCNRELFMFVKGEIGGFDPDTFYDVIIDVELYTSLLETYDGDLHNKLLGSFLKVAAMANEPQISNIPDSEDAELLVAEMDIDIGLEYESSQDVVNLGKLVYSETGFEPIVLRGFNADNPIRVKTNSDGKLWLMVGIDTNVSVYQDVYINFIGGSYGKIGS